MVLGGVDLLGGLLPMGFLRLGRTFPCFLKCSFWGVFERRNFVLLVHVERLPLHSLFGALLLWVFYGGSFDGVVFGGVIYHRCTFIVTML